MEIKNSLDGIQKYRKPLPAAKTRVQKARAVKVAPVVIIKPEKKFANVRRMDGIKRGPRVSVTNVPSWSLRFKKIISAQKVPMLAALIGIFLAFGGGAWFVLGAGNSRAANLAEQPEVLGDFTAVPSQPIVMPNAQVPAANTVSNNVLFNTPIEYLQQYLQDVSEPDIIAKRAEQIRQYLQEKNSPLAVAADTIAAQPHWDIIMAVAFAESSLGKNCVDNNCSNIGVKPGAPSWRHYSSYSAWAIDFNRLLDKKYKDWTLQQMCGVYVKPCNPNWLIATQQVMDQMQAEHIE